MQTQVSKKSRSKTTAPRSLSSNISRSIPSFSTMKKDAIRAFKNEASEKFSAISSFLPEGVADDAAQYAQQAVRWLRKNPGAATALAVVSGLAVGAVVRQALVSGGKNDAF